MYAFTHVTLVVSEEQQMQDATLLIKDGRIVATGPNLKLPSGAVVYDLKGKFIYPGLIDMYTTYGVTDQNVKARHPDHKCSPI